MDRDGFVAHPDQPGIRPRPERSWQESEAASRPVETSFCRRCRDVDTRARGKQSGRDRSVSWWPHRLPPRNSVPELVTALILAETSPEADLEAPRILGDWLGSWPGSLRVAGHRVGILRGRLAVVTRLGQRVGDTIRWFIAKV